jgi:hypothetical protein
MALVLLKFLWEILEVLDFVSCSNFDSLDELSAELNL